LLLPLQASAPVLLLLLFFPLLRMLL